LTDVVFELAALFEKLSIPYAIMGGVAVRAYSIPRPTYDVDFTLSIERERLPKLFAEVEALGYTVPEAYQRGWIDNVGGMSLVKFRIFLEGKSIDADVFLAETAHQQEVMRRRRRDEVEGQTLWIVSAEDLVLFKLIADRPRDRIDVSDILFSQGALDHDYIAAWAKKLGIDERWENALSEQLP
jgi:hypothetical protein